MAARTVEFELGPSEMTLDDGTDFTGGLNLAESLAYLMGWQCGLEDEPD